MEIEKIMHQMEQTAEVIKMPKIVIEQVIKAGRCQTIEKEQKAKKDKVY